MSIRLTELTPEENATRDLTTAMDSVTLVTRLLEDTSYTAATATAQVLNSIDRNYRHVNLVLNREWVINNNGGANLTPYTESVVAGKAYIVAAKAANNAAAADIEVK